MAEKRRNKAVTLIEMLVVLGIIVVLAGLVVALTLRVDNQSKERALDSAFSLLNSSLREYYETRDRFPDPNDPAKVLTSIEMMVQGLRSVPDSKRVLEQLNPDLVRNEAGDPQSPELRDPWGTVLNYVYSYDPVKGKGDTFPELISAGPDRQFGTADDISSKGTQRR